MRIDVRFPALGKGGQRLGATVMLERFIVLAWALLVLAPPVQQSLASLPAGFRLAESAVRSVATVNPVVALRLLSGAAYLQTPEPESHD